MKRSESSAREVMSTDGGQVDARSFFYSEQEVRQPGASWIRCGELMVWTLYVNLHNHDETRLIYCSQIVKLRSNCQTRQCWSDIHQDSVTALSNSHLRRFQEHVSARFNCVNEIV